MIKNINGRTLFAIALILFGSITLLNNSKIIPYDFADIFIIFWPIPIILLGLNTMVKSWKQRHKTHPFQSPSFLIGLLFLLFATNVQLSNLGLPYLQVRSFWDWFWPLIIIFIGLQVLTHEKAFSLRKRKGKGRNAERTPPLTIENASKHTIWIGESRIGDNPFELDDASYELGIGELSVNLTQAIMDEKEIQLDIRGWVGSINVYIPSNLPAQIHSSISLGSMTVVGSIQEGISKELTIQTEGFHEAKKRIILNVNLSVGEIRVLKV
ncbi:cell wall-active antibiotics response protein LiaF [Mechercharimyces sp. CAU 1602]|uniref:cell wall-active antibiotics response protein LiaF n=1 Tax=Mechercharimyces sp. CAU 1602 TaxID=2973933 RepID=UPI0021612A48|nr:cell wall-active antibiotics response protein LiaF [Mechercharimyces sp. CAU 1602]MCS1349981.1 cell wall-active antibiotics response protein LiaF [Mechercharimyces sp. CAU 1602]